MMFDKYKFFSNRYENKNNSLVEISTGLTSISKAQALKLINQYNIYFSLFCGDKALTTQNTCIYQLDNLKDLEDELLILKQINFPSKSNIYLYTDYKQNEPILLKRIEDAHVKYLIENSNTSASVLKNISQVDKDFCVKYLDSLEKNQTQSLFA